MDKESGSRAYLVVANHQSLDTLELLDTGEFLKLVAIENEFFNGVEL
jgi:hypothetical protein